MYRVSREGRRAHDHDPDNNGGGKSSRYNKERLVDAASSSASSSYAYSEDKSKAFPVGGGAAGVLRTRNSRASLCLKLTATSVGLFLLRGVSSKRSAAMCVFVPLLEGVRVWLPPPLVRVPTFSISLSLSPPRSK